MRACFFANSGGGKTNMIVFMLTNPRMYGGNVFDAVYVVSPSAKLDSTWQHLATYRAKRRQKEEEFFFDHWDAERVQKIIDESFKLTAHQKARQANGERVRAFSVFLCVDDMADNQSILHATGFSILNSAFIRARHAFLSVWIASQRPNLTSSIIRTQMSALIIFRQRNRKDFEVFVDEFSAMVDKKTLIQMYDIATKDKYNFLYINLLANDVDNMFFWNFDKRLVPSSIEEG